MRLKLWRRFHDAGRLLETINQRTVSAHTESKMRQQKRILKPARRPSGYSLKNLTGILRLQEFKPNYKQKKGLLLGTVLCENKLGG